MIRTRAPAAARAALSLTVALAGVAVLGDARADAPVLTVSPAALMLGTDRGATLDVQAGDVAPEQLEVIVSAGTVRDVTRVGPGHFTAHYEPPASRAPDVALLVVRVRGSAEAAAVAVPLAGRYRLAVSAEPGAEVAVRLAGEDAPRRAVASSSGTVQMVLHVPPGVGTATIEAVDRADNRTVRDEALELPPLHRVLILPAPPDPSPGRAREVRWWLAAATPAGALADEPPAFRVEGASARVERAAPGLFLLRVRPLARASAGRVSLRVLEPYVAAQPESVQTDVPPAEPARLALGPLGPAAPGAPVEVSLAVTDAEGEAVGGLAGRVAALLGGREASVEEREGGGYVLRGRAPERAGAAEVQVTLAGAALRDDATFDVHPGPAARLNTSTVTLPRGVDSEVELSAQDAFGNAASTAGAVVGSEGADVRAVLEQREGAATRVRLRPRGERVRLWLQSGEARTEALELPVAREPRNRPVVSMGLVARHNLRATMFYGTQMRLEYVLPLAGPVWAYGSAGLGVETALSGDAQGHNVVIETVPLGARVGLLARVGEAWVGLVALGGARWSFARDRLPFGGVNDATQWTPLVGGAVTLRWRSRAGDVSAELGAESGYLDTPAVRGTLGGIYGALAWGVGL